MSVKEVMNRELWNKLVLSSKYASPTHFFSNADHHIKISVDGETYIVAFREMRAYGTNMLLSYGTRMDGGLVPLISFNNLNKCISYLITYLKEKGYDVFNLTLKRYYLRKYIDKVVELISSLSKYKVSLYARILLLNNDFDYIWRFKFNKKARNLVRKFKRLGGYVQVLDNPLDYVDEIMEINLSKTFRQGRYLPPTYTNRKLVVENLKLSLEEKGESLRIYGAFIGNKLTAYAYIVEHNGYAYVSRFLAHASYFKHAVSNGLISEIIEDLCHRNVKILQYGYWSRHHTGVNHFLRQHGFIGGKVEAYYIPLSCKGSIVLKFLSMRDKVKESKVGDGFRRIQMIRSLYHKLMPRA